MRNAFAEEIFRLASFDEKIVILSGDIGNRLFDRFKSAYPDRFFNCGVAEANMASIAAGLAMMGYRPIIYTIATFNTLRCLEQIKIDICYHNLDVLIVGTGAGLSYASLGSTHHSLDDIAHIRVIPNIKILCPCDPFEVKALLFLSLQEKGPKYLRLGKKGEPNLHKNVPSIQIGKANVWREGENVCLLSTGNTLSIALQASNDLQKEKIFPEVVHFPTIKPLDTHLLLSCVGRFSIIAILEEHSILGGFYSTICEWICQHFTSIPTLIPIGAPDIFPKKIGSQEYLRKSFRISSSYICDKILTHIKETPCELPQPS